SDFDRDYSPSVNTGDTEIAYVKLASDSNLSGIYKTDPAGATATPLFMDPNVKSLLYWTGTNGRAEGSLPTASLDMSPKARRLLFGK
ncbi:MAG TPA: hypothetical protein VG820_09175, partial [Fimbriimonadaceae bacterium]|nr:hypothetical protein [Fimbriimonadaceae bacterium]